MISNVHQRLRDVTRTSHERLERDARVVARARAPADRTALVQAFHRLHAEAEAALAPWLTDVEGLEFERRQRTPVLDRDLADLGARAAPARPARISVGGVNESLGVLYVLEGSTLGGRFIEKALEGSGEGLAGLGFLNPYGARTGERWRAFLSVLDARARTAADEAQMAAGALAGFAFAEQCLCEGSDG